MRFLFKKIYAKIGEENLCMVDENYLFFLPLRIFFYLYLGISEVFPIS